MIAKLKANRLLALLLCLVMVVGLFPTMTFAAEDGYNIGDEVTISFTVQDNPGFCNFSGQINADWDVLELQKITLGDMMLSGSHVLDASVGEHYITYSSLEGITEDGVVFTARFRIKRDIVAGETYPVTFEIWDATGSNGRDPVSLTINGGSIKVAEAPAEIETGSLMISKTVTGEGADASQEFEFTVALHDADGAGVSGTFGSYSFTNGAATVKLKGGESATISDIPAGYTYTVTEAAVDHYTTTSTGASGTIAANETAKAEFTNTYSAPVEAETGSVKITKTVKGSKAPADDLDYEFKIKFRNSNSNASCGSASYIVTNAQGTTTSSGQISFNEDGYTFHLKDGESIIFSIDANEIEEEVISEVLIKEISTGEFATTSSGLYYGWCELSVNATKEVEFINDYGDAPVVPTPDPEYGSVKITKTVKGDKAPAVGIAYEFTAWVETSDRSAVSEVVSYRKTAADGTTSSGGVTIGKDGYTFSLKDGESIVFGSITSGRLVEVKEIVTGDFTTTSSGLTDDVCVISTDSTQMVAFVNDYGDADTPDEPTTPDEPDEPTAPTTPDEPDETTTPTTSAKQLNNVPKTGDESSVGIWIALALLSLVGMVALTVGRKQFDARQRK